MRELLARLVDAEVRRLTAALEQARADRNRAARAAVRWHEVARRHEAQAAIGRPVGRCGHQLAAVAPHAPLRVFCALPAGHQGWHRDGIAEWGPINDKARDAMERTGQ